MNTPRLLFLFLLVLTACARHPQAAPPAEIRPAQAAPPSQEYTDLSTAYGQLLGFRDDPLFIRHGFTANSPHAGWLDQVRAIGRRPGHSPEGPRLLAMLAVAIRQHGPDSPTARDFTTRFERELRLLRDAPASQPTPPPQPTPDTTRPEDSAVVSILYTGDTQGVLYPQPVLDSSVGGLSRRLPLLAKLRAADPNAVLLDAGDAFTSSSEQAMRNNSAMVVAMNRMHYDAMGLGLHDLGMGEARLRNLVNQAAFPVICTNLTFSGSDEWIKPYVLITRGGETMAVLSLLPPMSTPPVPGAQYTPAQEALRRYVPMLKTKAQLIVVLSQLSQAETEAALAGIQDVHVVLGDARGQAATTPPYIFPAMAKGLGVGQIQLRVVDGGLVSRSMHLLDDPTADADLEREIQRRK